MREGTNCVFGYPGGAILPTYDAMLDYPIRHVLVRHEQGAAHMADGYARASGRVGVAIATSGPGATNLVTGIATAMMDSSPIVCITGQVGRRLIGSDAFQETDITGITLPITKHNYLVTRAEDIAETIREAFYIAKSGRPGPVLVDITKDAQQAQVRVRRGRRRRELAGYRPDRTPGARRARARGRADRDGRAARHPRRPGHHRVGRDANWSSSSPSAARCPIAMTLLGLGGIPASHPLNLGMMGMHGEAWVNTAVQEADLLLAFGMRFDDRVTGNVKTYAPDAKKIHIDIDPAEINKNVRVDVALVGDLRETLRAVDARRAGGRPARRGSEHIGSLQGRRGRARHQEPARQRPPVRRARHPRPVARDEGRRARRHRRRPAPDVGSAVLPPRDAAIAAHLGRPRHDGLRAAGGDRREDGLPGGGSLGGRRRRRLPDDDGRARHVVQEELDINIAIINNGYLGMVRQWQEFFYDRRYAATPMLSPNFCKVAEAYGIKTARVDTRARASSRPCRRRARTRARC